MTTLEKINWDSIQSVIDSMRHPDQTDNSVTNDVTEYMEQFNTLVSEGWPYQEIVMSVNSDEPFGVPVELAQAVLCIFQFCADKNIDLSSAIKMIKNV